MEELFMRLILDKDYTEFMTEAIEYFKEDEECKINDLTDIIKGISIATLLIGLTKKPVRLNEYEIKLKNKRKKIKVNSKEFCIVFKKYIEKVEKVKLDMLKEIT